MELSLVVAIIHRDKLTAAERRLREIGVRGITVINAKGFGEQSLREDVLGHVLMDDQVKIEIYAGADQAERIATTVMNAAHTGSRGDGIVAILPVQRVFSVRTRSEMVPNEVRG